MRSASTALVNHLASEVTTLATCWKVTRRDGTVMGFTDYLTDLTVSGVHYVAATGATPTGISSSDQFSVDNLDVQGILSSDAITEHDIGAGLYDYAAIQIFTVNATDLTQGIMLYRVGWLGEVTVKNGQFTAELRGLAQLLQQNIGEIFSPSCRAIFGDSRCKINLASYTFNGTVTALSSQQAFYSSSLTQASGYFTSGEIQWLAGANAGLRMEIKTFLNGQVTFVLPMPNAIAIGDTFKAVAGCDKSFPTCYSRFANAVNFRGEPYVPGMDQLLTTSATSTNLREV